MIIDISKFLNMKEKQELSTIKVPSQEPKFKRGDKCYHIYTYIQ